MIVRSDPAVSASVQQILKQLKSKRMMLFGLKNLAKICSSSSNKFEVNCLDALSRDVVPALLYCAENYSDDEEVIYAVITVLYGISEALVQNRDTENIKKLETEEGLKAGLLVLKTSSNVNITEHDIFELALQYVQNLQKLQFAIDEPQIAIYIAKNVKVKSPVNVVENILYKLLPYTEKPDCVEAMNKKEDNVTSIVLNVLDDQKHLNNLKTVQAVLKIVNNLSKSATLTTSQIDQVFTIVDKHRDNALIQDIGGVLLSSKFGHEELNMCINNLNAEKGSPQRQQAYMMLSALSYVSTYANSIAKSNGIPILANAIQTTVSDLLETPNDKQLLKCLMGMIRMMGKIASNPLYTQEAIDAGGLNSLIFALQNTENPENCSNIGLAIIPFIKNNLSEVIIVEENLGNELLQKAEKFSKHPEATHSIMKTLQQIFAYEKISADSVLVKNTTQLVIKVIKNNSKNDSVILSSLSIAELCLRRSQSISPEIAKDFYIELQKILDKAQASSDINMASSCLKTILPLVETNAPIPDKDGLFSSVFAVLMIFDQDSDIKLGKRLVELLADESAVQKALQNLYKASAKPNTKASTPILYAALSAVSGLSQIEKLKPIFIPQGADTNIIQTLSNCVKAPPFEEQQKIIKACCSIISSLCDYIENSDKLILDIEELCLNPNCTKFLEKQSSNDNSVLDLLDCLIKLNSCKKPASTESLNKIIGSTSKLINKYQDWRSITSKIFIFLKQILMQADSECKGALIECAIIKSVLTIMKRLNLVEEVQVASLELLLQILKLDKDDEFLNLLKMGGAVDVCKQAYLAHSKSTKVRILYQNIINLLQPESEMENEIKRLIENISKTSNPNGLLSALEDLNRLMGSTNAVRFAAMYRVGAVLDNIISNINIHTPPMRRAITCASVECCDVISQSRAGLNHLQCFSIYSHLLTISEEVNLELVSVKDDPKLKAESRKTLLATSACLKRIVGISKLKDDDERIRKTFAVYSKILLDNIGDEEIVSNSVAVLTKLNKEYNMVLAKDFSEFFALINSRYEATDATLTEKLELSAILKKFYEDNNVKTIESCNKRMNLKSILKDIITSSDTSPELTTHLIELIDMMNNPRLLEGMSSEERTKFIESLIQIIKNETDYDIDVRIKALHLLSVHTTEKDKATLQSADFLSILQEISTKASENSKFTKASGKILQIIGGEDVIEFLINKAIETISDKHENWESSLESLLKKLILFLPANVSDPDKTYKNLARLTELLAKNCEVNDKENLIFVSHEFFIAVGNKFHGNSPHGIQNVKSYIPILAKALDKPSKPVHKTQTFVDQGYMILKLALENPQCASEAVKLIKNHNLVEAAINCFLNNQENTKALSFLSAYVTADPQGAAMVTKFLASSEKNVADQFISSVISCMKKNMKKNPSISADGTNVLCSILKEKESLISKSHLDAMLTINQECGLTQTLHFLTKLAESGLLSKFEMDHNGIHESFAIAINDSSMGLAERQKLQMAYMKYIAAIGESPDAPELLENIQLILENVMEVLQNYDPDDEVLLSVLDACIGLVNSSPEACSTVAISIPKILLQKYPKRLVQDPNIAMKTVELFYLIQCDELNAQVISKLDGFKELVEEFTIQAPQFDKECDNQFSETMQDLKRVIKENTTKELTLQLIYELWNSKVNSGESLLMKNSSSLIHQFNVLCDKLMAYSRIVHSEKDTEESKVHLRHEFIYGCKALQLFYEEPQNSSSTFDSGACDSIIQALKVQTEQTIIDEVIRTALSVSQYSEAAAIFISSPDATIIIVKSFVDRRQYIKSIFPSDRKKRAAAKETHFELINPHLKLIQQSAVSDHTFDGTKCMSELLNLWQDYENDVYDDKILPLLFKTMRYLYNASWATLMKEQNVFTRLYTVVVHTKNYEVLRDALFLVSSLSSPYAEDKICLRMIDAIIDLINNCLFGNSEGQDTLPVITNSCLTLARISIYNENTMTHFRQKNGFEIPVQVLLYSVTNDMDIVKKLAYQKLTENASAEESAFRFDLANAASIMICNLCYRRDSVKKIMGDLKAPAVLCKCLRRYNGSDSVKAVRALRSLFTAIGNLSLYIPNVFQFAEEDIELVILHLFEFSDILAEDCMQGVMITINNLVLDYDANLSLKFGILIIPILESLIKSKSHKRWDALICYVDVFTNLCRHPDNAARFVNHPESIPFLQRIYLTYNNSRLNYSIVSLYSVLSTHPELIDNLLKAGFLKVLITIFNEGSFDESTDLIVPSLRSLRRVLKVVPNPIQTIYDPSIKQAILNAVNLSKPLSLNQHEALITFTWLLCMTISDEEAESAPSKAEDEDWELPEVQDEEVLGWQHHIDRPLAPRRWALLQLSNEEVHQIIIQLCNIMKSDSQFRQKKTQQIALHLLAYFACEKILETNISFYVGDFNIIISRILKNYHSYPEMILRCCTVLANVLYMSDHDNLKTISKDAELIDAMHKALKANNSRQHPEQHRMLTALIRLINVPSIDARSFEPYIKWDYKIFDSNLLVPKYPKGVSDLPGSVKQTLRLGGKAKSITPTGVVPLTWAATQDLTRLLWKFTDSDAAMFCNQIGIARVRSITTGRPESEPKDSKADFNNTVTITGPPCDPAQGSQEIRLTIKLDNSKKVQNLVELLSEWKEAATY